MYKPPESGVPSQVPSQEIPQALQDGVIKKSIMDISFLIVICLGVCAIIAYFAGIIFIAGGIYSMAGEHEVESAASNDIMKGILDLILAAILFFISYPLALHIYKRKEEWWQKIKVS